MKKCISVCELNLVTQKILTFKCFELASLQRMNVFEKNFTVSLSLAGYEEKHRRPHYGILTKMHLKEFDKTESLRQILELPISYISHSSCSSVKFFMFNVFHKIYQKLVSYQIIITTFNYELEFHQIIQKVSLHSEGIEQFK